MLYLLQLVQALKFESSSTQSPSSSSIRHSRHMTSSMHHHRSFLAASGAASNDTLPTLADFLIDRSARNPVLGNHFHWYIAVECEDKQRGAMFRDIAKRFDRRVADVSVEHVNPRELCTCDY